MSEEKAEVKKKGKLPVIVAVVAILFGGGFFMMKSKGGEKKEPEVKLGKIVELDEKLVNLSDQTTFLRTTIALHLKEGFDETKMKDLMPAVDDAVVTTLKSLGPNDVKSLSALAKLKRRLAASVNDILAVVAHDEHADKKGEAEAPEGVGEGKPKDGAKDKEAKPESSSPKHPDWESDEGPVLKVYFRAFAIQ